MRRLALFASVSLFAALILPGMASAASAPHRSGPQALPAHSSRAVCGAPGAGTAACASKVVTHAHTATPLATSSYTYGYRPVDLQSAYQLPSSTGKPGSGPTVAIVDAYDNPNAETDLGIYRTRFGLGDCTTANGCFTKVNQTGGSTYPKSDTGWGAEIDLDIEMVSAACPSCKILLVEASSNSFADLMAAVAYATAHANFVSNSYGGNEFSGETSYDSYFNKPGIGITVSSGDSGYGVEYPAASQYVTAVGGTSLTGSSTTGWSETAWSGAGSGCSAVEPKPSWQHDKSCSKRTVADVSAVADPNTGVAVYDSYGSSGGNNWYVYGGTSVAAPLVAGVWALAGALPTGTVAGQVPYLNTGGWTDITSGTNSHHCRDGYLCQAMGGYDGPTGWGTPIGTNGFTNTGSTTSSSPTASFTDSCADLSCTFTDTSTDSGGTITGWSWTFGDGGTSSVQNPSHTYSVAGKYTVTLTVTDSGGATGSTSQQVTVSAPSTGGITLSVTNTYKVKGVEYVTLSWAGATSSVDLYRDGSFDITVSGTSTTDNTHHRGGATFTYYVCNAGTSTCSNTVTVTF